MDKIPESLKNARFAALDLLKDYNILTPPVNLSSIFLWEGIKVYEFPFPTETDSIAWLLDIEQKFVLINENDEDFNKPFTAAHELWHWLLHKNYMNKHPEKYSLVFKKRWKIDNEDYIEKEANCFARNLLVPKFMLDTYKDYLSIWELAKVFGVSPLLIEQRLSQEYFE